jgi:HEAT repeat protein
MNNHASKNLLSIIYAAFGVCLWAVCADAQAPLPVAKAQHPYDQCASISKGSSNDDAVAKAIAALKEKDPKARAQAVEQLGKSCDGRAVEPLIDLLANEDPAARIAAIEALGRLGDINAIQPLLELTVTEKDWHVRMALISSLASFKSTRTRSGVLNGIANPGVTDISDINDMYVRCSAILTCNQFSDVGFSRKAILFLYNFLKSKYPTTQQIAEKTLYELKNTRNAATEFRAILKNDHNPELRRWAAEWIGKIGFENLGEALTEAAAIDSDAKVKQAATTALAALKNTK